MFRIAILFFVLVLQGCTATYVAQERTLEEGRIAGFPVNGTVKVVNPYQQEVPAELRRSYVTDLKQVTDVFVEQLSNEIARNGRHSNGAEKWIVATVESMSVVNRRVYHEARIQVKLELGNGETVSFERRDGHPMGEPRALNSVISRAVMETLAHPRVLAYLAQ